MTSPGSPECASLVSSRSVNSATYRRWASSPPPPRRWGNWVKVFYSGLNVSPPPGLLSEAALPTCCRSMQRALKTDSTADGKHRDSRTPSWPPLGAPQEHGDADGNLARYFIWRSPQYRFTRGELFQKYLFPIRHVQVGYDISMIKVDYFTFFPWLWVGIGIMSIISNECVFQAIAIGLW